MAGRIKTLIDEIIQKRTAGRSGFEHFVRANLVMQGIHPDKYDETSDDDPEILVRLQRMLSEFELGQKGASR